MEELGAVQNDVPQSLVSAARQFEEEEKLPEGQISSGKYSASKASFGAKK